MSPLRLRSASDLYLTPPTHDAYRIVLGGKSRGTPLTLKTSYGLVRYSALLGCGASHAPFAERLP